MKTDATLSSHLADLLGPKHPVFVAATVTPAAITLALQGAHEDSPFELASISKGITGLLYSDALSRGQISANTVLGDLLPSADTPLAQTSLKDLSIHQSGIPSVPKIRNPRQRNRTFKQGKNPYGDTLAELIEQAKTVKPGRKRIRYSNFGYELLGHALAAASGTSFAELVQQRIVKPFDLQNMSVPHSEDELGPAAIRGINTTGEPQQAWTGEALGPAGGIRASATDMAKLLHWLLGGKVPGISALDPVAPFAGGMRIGAAWITIGHGDDAITWHNGRSGGFGTWIGLNRTARTGAVILSATATSIDRHGFTLLNEITPKS